MQVSFVGDIADMLILFLRVRHETDTDLDLKSTWHLKIKWQSFNYFSVIVVYW